MGDTSEPGLLSVLVIAVAGAVAAGGGDIGARDMAKMLSWGTRCLVPGNSVVAGLSESRLQLASLLVFRVDACVCSLGSRNWRDLGVNCFWLPCLLWRSVSFVLVLLSFLLFIFLSSWLMFGDCVHARCSDGLGRGQHGLFNSVTH